MKLDIVLVDNTYNSDEAKYLINNLIRDKVNHLQKIILSNKEKDKDCDVSFYQQRIKELSVDGDIINSHFLKYKDASFEIKTIIDIDIKNE